MSYYSRRHYERVCPRPDTEREVEMRRLDKEASASALADREARFPVLCAENAERAMALQADRLQFHRVRLGLISKAPA